MIATEEDAARLRRSYEDLNGGDIEAALSVLAPDAMWRESAELPGGEKIRGRAAVHRFLCGFLETWSEFRQEVEDVTITGDRVALVIHLTAVGRGSGVEVDARYAHVWTLGDDGLATCVDAYRDPETALGSLEARPATDP